MSSALYYTVSTTAHCIHTQRCTPLQYPNCGKKEQFRFTLLQYYSVLYYHYGLYLILENYARETDLSDPVLVVINNQCTRGREEKSFWLKKYKESYHHRRHHNDHQHHHLHDSDHHERILRLGVGGCERLCVREVVSLMACRQGG